MESELVQQTQWEFDSVQLTSKFDSGNLVWAEQTGKTEFDLWIGADCAGTEFESVTRIWYHFLVEAPKGASITFSIRNLNQRGRMYKEGFRPFYKNNVPDGEWVREPGEFSYGISEFNVNCYQVSFTHWFATEEVYFAFCFPWSYQENQAMLAQIS